MLGDVIFLRAERRQQAFTMQVWSMRYHFNQELNVSIELSPCIGYHGFLTRPLLLRWGVDPTFSFLSMRYPTGAKIG